MLFTLTISAQEQAGRHWSLKRGRMSNLADLIKSFRLRRYFRCFLHSPSCVTKASCYSNGSQSPHRHIAIIVIIAAVIYVLLAAFGQHDD